MNEIFCRPKWYGQGVANPAELTKYKAIKVQKNSPEVEDIFNQKYLDGLPEEFVWKIIANREPVYRSNEDFKEEFDIVE